MVIEWSKQANKSVDSLLSYYRNMAGERVARKMVANIMRSAMRLERSPQMAAIDLLLESLPKKYRSLVVRKNFKVIYYIDEQKDRIYIADVWDCRQDPKKLMRRLNDWE
ncbi:Plasmid stabilization system protein [Bacteroidales bacterium Barb4]|nr:Plasmid stabilization system protein [Bacteroidales bacterium Barb4]